MNTREKILEASRIAFNIKGVSNVSVRDICKDLGISAGNFSYHYPSKSKIVEELYQNLLLEIKDVFITVFQKSVGIRSYLETHKLVFEIQLKYKFFYLNLFEILMNYPEIKQTYLNNISTERKNAYNILALYKSNKIINPDIKLSDFERILNIGQILNNSWQIDAEIVFNGDKKEAKKYYMTICCGLLEPYLTETSLIEYREFFAEL